jgi:hypothetical protein
MIDLYTGFKVRLVKQSDFGPFWAWLLGPGGIEESYVACLETTEIHGPFDDLEVARRRLEAHLE